MKIGQSTGAFKDFYDMRGSVKTTNTRPKLLKSSKDILGEKYRAVDPQSSDISSEKYEHELEDEEDYYRQGYISDKERFQTENLGSISVSEVSQLTSQNSLSSTRRVVKQEAFQQREKQEEWLLEDSQFVGQSKSIVKQDFTEKSSFFMKPDLWERTQFNCGRLNENPSPVIIGDFMGYDLRTNKKGLFMKSEILKANTQMNLRSFGAQFEITTRMYGNSSFWLFTRILDGSLEHLSPIVIIRKMTESQRVFAIFGAVITRKQKDGTFAQIFKFFKYQEIPHFYYDAELDEYYQEPPTNKLMRDCVDVSFRLIDNGDDKVCLEVHLDKDKYISIMCDMYIPMLEPSTFMVAAAGHKSYLRSIKVKQVTRQEYFHSGLVMKGQKQYECCCSIF